MKNVLDTPATILSCLCLAASLAGCSSHEQNLDAKTAEATPVVPEPVSTQTSEATPATVSSPMPTGEQTPEPLPAVSNEPDQAGPAAQAEAELAAPVEASSTDSTPTAAAAEISAVDSPATIKAQVHIAAHAVTPAIKASTQVSAATHVAAQTQSASPALSAKALRVQRFRQFAMQLKAPVLLAGNEKQGTVMYSLKLGNIGITNLDNSVLVHFAMKSMDTDWRNESLSAEDTQEFGCGSMQHMQECLFWMRTGTKPAVFYTMHTPQRYAIVWNGDNGMWDLRLVDNDDTGQ